MPEWAVMPASAVMPEWVWDIDALPYVDCGMTRANWSRGTLPSVTNKAHILGAGGIGIATAACLVRAGWAVTMVDANAAKVASGRSEGMVLDDQPPIRVDFVDFDSWSAPADATILLCTKTFDNAAVLARLRHDQAVVPVQNGFEPELERREHPSEAIASFVSACPADRPVARITRPGSLHIGARRAVSAAEAGRIAELAGALRAGNLFAVEHVEDVRPFKATKLMYNAAISPLAASAGVDNAGLLSDPLAQRLFFALLRENYSILHGIGQRLEKIGPFHPTTVMRILSTPGLPGIMGVFFRPSLRGTYCSMSPDMGSGRTEVDAYNGHLVRIAGAVPCPMNRAVIALVDRISKERSAPSPLHLRQLAATVWGGVRK
jgi:2-dehydropantoate 2-reductase